MPDRAPQQPAETLPPAFSASLRLRALVIDDDTRVRKLVCEFLEGLGLHAADAANGTEGLALFEQGGYDLVVTDLMMPDMTGWDVTDAVRRRSPAPGVIMVTGSVANLDTARARASGLTIVAKPFSLEDLKSAVAQALGAEARVAAPGGSAPGAGDDRMIGGEGSTSQNPPLDVLNRLRAAFDGVRKTADECDAALGCVEEFVREHESTAAVLARLRADHDTLRQEHATLVETVTDLRDQHRVLTEERRRTVAELRAIIRRLQPRPQSELDSP